MKKYLKIFSKIAIALALITCLVLSIHGGGKTHADSGYDTSYNSGSSSSSSYSSGSSSHSSSRSHSSYGGSSSSSSSSGDGLVAFVIWVIIIIIIIYFSRKRGLQPTTASDMKLVSNTAAVAKLKELVPGFEEGQFLWNGYQIFLNVQDAWTNFDLEKVRESITDEMFNQYESQLSSMEIKGEQNIMKDFVLKSSAITNCINQNDNIEVTTKYIVEFYDYIVDKESGNLKRGSKTNKVRMYYDMTFVMSASQTKITHCPNCGAEVNVSTSGTCQYCGSKIIGENADWVLSKKLCYKQTNL